MPITLILEEVMDLSELTTQVKPMVRELTLTDLPSSTKTLPSVMLTLIDSHNHSGLPWATTESLALIMTTMLSFMDVVSKKSSGS